MRSGPAPRMERHTAADGRKHAVRPALLVAGSEAGTRRARTSGCTYADGRTPPPRSPAIGMLLRRSLRRPHDGFVPLAPLKPERARSWNRPRAGGGANADGRTSLGPLTWSAVVRSNGAIEGVVTVGEGLRLVVARGDGAGRPCPAGASRAATMGWCGLFPEG
jgi:hypothetical protein